MAEYLEWFDLDLLPSMSPDTSDNTGGGSKEEQLEKLSFIMSAAEKDHPQSTMAPVQDEEISNNMNFTPSDEAYALEAVNLLDLDVVSDDTATPTGTSEDGRVGPNVEIPLSQGQLELIMQTTGICTTRTEAEQTHSQPIIIKENTNRESNCSVFIIKVKVPAIPATSQDAVSIVTSTTTGCQSRNPPLKANKPSRRRREKKEKFYQKSKFDDEEQEAKRQRAINAHIYRGKKKQEKMALGLQIEEVVKERDEIKIEVEKEKGKNKKLMAKLELVKDAFDQA